MFDKTDARKLAVKLLAAATGLHDFKASLSILRIFRQALDDIQVARLFLRGEPFLDKGAPRSLKLEGLAVDGHDKGLGHLVQTLVRPPDDRGLMDQARR